MSNLVRWGALGALVAGVAWVASFVVGFAGTPRPASYQLRSTRNGGLPGGARRDRPCARERVVDPHGRTQPPRPVAVAGASGRTLRVRAHEHRHAASEGIAPMGRRGAYPRLALSGPPGGLRRGGGARDRLAGVGLRSPSGENLG